MVLAEGGAGVVDLGWLFEMILMILLYVVV